MSKQSTISIIVLSLLIIATGYYVFYVRVNVSQANIRQFAGDFVSVEGNVIKLHGVFSGLEVPASLVAERDFSFTTNANTQFKKAEMRWPDWDELAKTGTTGTIDLKDLPRTEGAGSIEDLKSSFLSNSDNLGWLRVEANFPNSIQNAKNPVASSVFYEIMIMPPPPTQPQNQ